MSNILEYNGYHARIEFSNEDETFIGKVLGLQDTLVFEGETVEDLKNMFRASIDEYIEYCAHIGKEPDKEFKGSFNVRIPSELHRRAVFESERRGISLNQFVQESIENLLSGEREIIKERTYVLTIPMGLENYQLQGSQEEYAHGESQNEGALTWKGSSFNL